ncbi:hypothetical protein [Kalamiella sp. sgz302252]|uniref:hypothetical protein n=1 Tax=Pantoea sp. sgz302252 TaxID=3341827 RepID=UPI0036D32CE7
MKVEDESITHCVIIHTLISHKRMFGEFGREKADPAAMRILREDVRQKVEEFHQQKIRYPALRADN